MHNEVNAYLVWVLSCEAYMYMSPHTDSFYFGGVVVTQTLSTALTSVCRHVIINSAIHLTS